MEADQGTNAANRGSALSEGLGAWQPIATAPRDGTAVLVWPPTWNGTASAAKWNPDKRNKRPRPYWARNDVCGSETLSRDKPPTHWMPIPFGPNGESA